MSSKKTYAAMMKQLSSKKAQYEKGLEEANRMGNRSGIADYNRRLAKLSAGMDELFQAQEASKAPQGNMMALGGMSKNEGMYATGGTYANGLPKMMYDLPKAGNGLNTARGESNMPIEGSAAIPTTNKIGMYKGQSLLPWDGRLNAVVNEDGYMVLGTAEDGTRFIYSPQTWYNKTNNPEIHAKFLKNERGLGAGQFEFDPDTYTAGSFDGNGAYLKPNQTPLRGEDGRVLPEYTEMALNAGPAVNERDRMLGMLDATAPAAPVEPQRPYAEDRPRPVDENGMIEALPGSAGIPDQARNTIQGARNWGDDLRNSINAALGRNEPSATASANENGTQTSVGEGGYQIQYVPMTKELWAQGRVNGEGVARQKKADGKWQAAVLVSPDGTRKYLHANDTPLAFTPEGHKELISAVSASGIDTNSTSPYLSQFSRNEAVGGEQAPNASSPSNNVTANTATATATAPTQPTQSAQTTSSSPSSGTQRTVTQPSVDAQQSIMDQFGYRLPGGSVGAWKDPRYGYVGQETNTVSEMPVTNPRHPNYIDPNTDFLALASQRNEQAAADAAARNNMLTPEQRRDFEKAEAKYDRQQRRQERREKGNNFLGKNKETLGLLAGHAAQFIPDLMNMREIRNLEGPVDRDMLTAYALNTDLQVGNQLQGVQDAYNRNIASIDQNVSNPAVAAAMKRASQRVAAGQEAQILGNEANTEMQLRNQNLQNIYNTINANKDRGWANEQAKVDFENQRAAALNRIRTGMGDRIGAAYTDFANRAADRKRWELMSKLDFYNVAGRNNIDDILGLSGNTGD